MGKDGKGGQTLGGGADDTERRGGNRGRAKKLLHILHFELAYPIVVDRFASLFGLNSICILSSTAGDHSNRVTRVNDLHFTTRLFNQLLTILQLVFTHPIRIAENSCPRLVCFSRAKQFLASSRSTSDQKMSTSIEICVDIKVI